MNSEKSLAPSPSEELPWLAFLYVSEELPPEETQDFEERLMSDQAAREAVAQAMKMSEGLWMASAMDSLNIQPATTPAPQIEPAADSRTSRQRSRSMMWLVSTITLASLAFCVGWWFARPPADSNSPALPAVAQSDSQSPAEIEPARAADVQGAEQLLGLWTDSESLLAELEAGPAAEYSASEASSQEHPHSEDEAFSWMLAAVSDHSTTLPPAEPAVMEN